MAMRAMGLQTDKSSLFYARIVGPDRASFPDPDKVVSAFGVVTREMVDRVPGLVSRIEDGKVFEAVELLSLGSLNTATHVPKGWLNGGAVLGHGATVMQKGVR